MMEKGGREKWRKRLRKRRGRMMRGELDDERGGDGGERKAALSFIEDDLVEFHK